MHNPMNEFESLVARVGQGDHEARAQLDARLVAIVREVLRRPRALTPQARWILAEARRTARGALVSSAEAREQLVSQVSRRLRDLILDGLWPDRGCRPEAETLCALRELTSCLGQT